MYLEIAWGKEDEETEPLTFDLIDSLTKAL